MEIFDIVSVEMDNSSSVQENCDKNTRLLCIYSWFWWKYFDSKK